MRTKCTECGSERLEPGRLTSAGEVSFIPRHAKFLAGSSAVKVDAQVCADCGHLLLGVDAETLRRKADVDQSEQ